MINSELAAFSPSHSRILVVGISHVSVVVLDESAVGCGLVSSLLLAAFTWAIADSLAHHPQQLNKPLAANEKYSFINFIKMVDTIELRSSETDLEFRQ